MYFPTALLFLFFSPLFTTSLPLPTTPLKSRDFPSTTANITTVINDLYALEAAVTAFTGSQAGALSVRDGAGKLDKDLNIATADIGASTYSVPESAALRGLVEPLGPIHTTGLAALNAKAPMFAALGVTAKVESQLLQLSLDNNNFWTVLVGKLTTSDRDAVEAAGNQARAAYQNTLLVFGT